MLVAPSLSCTKVPSWISLTPEAPGRMAPSSVLTGTELTAEQHGRDSALESGTQLLPGFLSWLTCSPAVRSPWQLGFPGVHTLSYAGEIHLRLLEAEATWIQRSLQPSSSRRACQAQGTAELRSYSSLLGAAPFLQAVWGCASPWKR